MLNVGMCRLYKIRLVTMRFTIFCKVWCYVVVIKDSMLARAILARSVFPLGLDMVTINVIVIYNLNIITYIFRDPEKW